MVGLYFFNYLQLAVSLSKRYFLPVPGTITLSVLVSSCRRLCVCGVAGVWVGQVCESSLNTLVNLRGKMSFVAEKGTAGQQRLTNGKDGGSIEVNVPSYCCTLAGVCSTLLRYVLIQVRLSRDGASIEVRVQGLHQHVCTII